MKNLFRFSILTFTVASIFIACEKPVDPDQGVTIQGIPDLSVVTANEVIGPLLINLLARDGLASFEIEINGQRVIQKKLTGEISFSTPFTFYPNHIDAGKQFQINFSATDMDGDIKVEPLEFSVSGGKKTISIDSVLTTNQTWTNDNTYILAGRIIVQQGVTLTIEKGVIVKASERLENAVPSGLVISRGAKIIAQGTSTEPIIFTSTYSTLGTSVEAYNTLSDEIKTWDAGPLGNGKVYLKDNANWGGITILGSARSSFSGNSSEVYLSDVPLPEEMGKYGGENLEDNSGTLKHVIIIGSGIQEFEKYRIGGLTLAGVGSGTTIENVEMGGIGSGGVMIPGIGTDGILIKGGNVNLKNIIVTNYKNAVTISQGWSGVMENFYLNSFGMGVVINGPEGVYFDKNHLLIKGSLESCFPEGIIHFDENSNTDMSKLFFWSQYEVPGINLFPSRFSPKVSELMTPLDYKKFFPSEFHPFFVPLSNEPGAPGADYSKLDWLIFNYISSNDDSCL